MRASSGVPVGNADVWLEQHDQVWKTASPGDVLIEDLHPGAYVVWAGTGELGAGYDSVSVTPGGITEVAIHVTPGRGVIPRLSIYAPQGTSYTDSVRVEVAVFDRQDPPEKIALQWESDLDGALGSATPDSLGRAVLMTLLSLGTHRISINAIDTDGHVGRAAATIVIWSASPYANITRPRPSDIFVPGDSIHFQAIATDMETAHSSLIVRWMSDRDGLLDTTPPNADGLCGFSSVSLSPGVHSITLSVSDSDGNETHREATVRNTGIARVRLDPIIPRSNANHLSWSVSDSPEFDSYVIYRTGSSGVRQWLTSISDRDQNSHEDRDIELGHTYAYSVRVLGRDGRGSDSTPQEVRSGLSIEVNAALSKLLPDPARPWVYAVARPGDAVFFIKSDATVFDRLDLPGRDLTDIDLAPDGQSLYAIDFARDEILVVDLESRALVRTISIPATDRRGDHFHIEAGRQGRIYWVDAAWAPELHVMDASSGIEIARLPEVGVGDLEISPDGDTMYLWYQFGWSAGQAGSWLYRLDCAVDPPGIDEIGSTNVGRDPLDAPILLTSDGTTVFCKGLAFPANDLANSGIPFAQPIYAITPSGDIAFSETTVSHGDGATRGRMPLTTRALATSPDGTILYLGDEDSRQLFLYELPVDPAGHGRAAR